MARKLMIRFVVMLLVAVWVVLWPANYGINAHTWWLRLGAVLLLAVRAAFIGYGAAMVIFRPVLTIRRSGDIALPSIPQAVRRDVAVVAAKLRKAQAMADDEYPVAILNPTTSGSAAVCWYVSAVDDIGVSTAPIVRLGLEVHGDDELDALVAVLSGAVQRVPPGATWVTERLGELRERFIEADAELRQRMGLPL